MLIGYNFSGYWNYNSDLCGNNFYYKLVKSSWDNEIEMRTEKTKYPHLYIFVPIKRFRLFGYSLYG